MRNFKKRLKNRRRICDRFLESFRDLKGLKFSFVGLVGICQRMCCMLLGTAIRDYTATWNVWNLLIPTDQHDRLYSNNLQDWLTSNLQNRHNFRLGEVDWQCLFGIIIWCIWKNHNFFIFQGISWSTDDSITVSSSWAKHFASTGRVLTCSTQIPTPCTQFG